MKQILKKAVYIGFVCEVMSLSLILVPMQFSKWGPCGPIDEWLNIPFFIGGFLNFTFLFIPDEFLYSLSKTAPLYYLFLGLVFFFHFAIWAGIWSAILFRRSKRNVVNQTPKGEL